MITALAVSTEASDRFTVSLTEEDASNLRVILGLAMSIGVTAEKKWRDEAARLYDLIGDARDRANPGGDKAAPFRPAT